MPRGLRRLLAMKNALIKAPVHLSEFLEPSSTRFDQSRYLRHVASDD